MNAYFRTRKYILRSMHVHAVHVPGIPRIVNRKPNLSVVFRFFSIEKRSFQSFFSVAHDKRNRKTDYLVGFSVCFVLQPTAAKKRPKQSDNFGEKTEKPIEPKSFRLFSVHNQPWSPHDTNTCTLTPLNCCLFRWFHRETDRETDREVFGFGFVFFG